MNDQILSGQWKHMKGILKSWWGQFSDDDFNRIGGEKDKLIGWVQERYGRSREQAAREVEDLLNEYARSGKRTFADLVDKADDIGQTVIDNAEDAAHAVRSRLNKARAYLQGTTLESFGANVRGLVRQYPVQSMLIGIGVGIWLSRRR